jgi:DNA polymerase-3 subunit delta
MHATAFLKAKEKPATGGLVVLSGGERSLKLEVLNALVALVCGDGDESSLTRFNGQSTDWRTVHDELLTVSMWGDRRLVFIETADDSGRARKKGEDATVAQAGDELPSATNFVAVNREALEKYIAKPSKKSVLVLDVQSFPKTTRLYKAVQQSGLLIECTELQGADLTRWVLDTVTEKFGKQITRDAALLVTELAGTHLGQLEQELAKVASFAGARPQLTSDDVRQVVGGWKAETIWVMLNALRDGQLPFALENLHKLLMAGEPGLKLLGGIAFVFRKLALATELSRHGTPLGEALRQANVFPGDLAATERYLRRIGRPQAEQISHWLLEADLALKGSSRNSERVVLEQLFVKLSGKLGSRPAV